MGSSVRQCCLCRNSKVFIAWQLKGEVRGVSVGSVARGRHCLEFLDAGLGAGPITASVITLYLPTCSSDLSLVPQYHGLEILFPF